MRGPFLFHLAWVATLHLLVATSTWAVNLETLIMPGDLIEGHAEYEDDCTECHERFSKEAQSRLCRDCHEEVTADVEAGKGYHGLSAEVRDKECRTCHTDHKGRLANVVPLDKERFNHKATDFPLRGAHIKVECDACHEPKKLYREAPSQCIECHEDHDPHKGRLGEECNECHQAKSWKRPEFDHAVTDFPLLNKHEELACASCHPNQRYEGTPTECYSCHALNDVHEADYGKRCDRCHTPKDWDSSLFDHDRDTKFALKDGHSEVSCGACHEGELYDQERDDDCFACHRNDDTHDNRHGEECDKCHSPVGWTRAKFDHKKDTDFPLRGKHEDLPCRTCHKGRVENEELEVECYACHRGDDIHAGQQGEQCEACHEEKGWGNRVAFEHDLTRFPLIGLHSTAPCEECHLTATFKDAPITCISCHEHDDDHEQKLGDECAQCHNPNGWSLWRFDHDEQTDFNLDGEHEDLACHACHTMPADKPAKRSRQCNACHWQDDSHDGRFGLNCTRCHNTEGFKPAAIVPG